MPTRAPRPCAQPGCSALVERGHCPDHERTSRAQSTAYDARRGSSSERGYGARWQRLRLRILRRDLYQCQECKRQGRLTLAGARKGDAHVDHIVPKSRGGTDDPANLETLCRSCHSRKTATEDGGFGRGV